MAGTTSLLKSAASARKKVQAQQDAEVAFQYSNSTKSYEEYKQYSDYLQSRFNSSTDPGEQLSLQKTIKSAQSGYISNEIQRASQAVMEGRAALEDKQQAVGNLWQQAVDVGNYDLALSLQSNWDNLSVQIQNRNDAAQQAQITLANAQEAFNKKMSSATGRVYGDLASSLTNGLEDLTRAFQQGGQVAYNTAAKKFVNDHRDAFKQLGIDLPADTSTNVGQLMEGMVKATANYYALAAQATEADNPDLSQTYKEKLSDIVSGKTTFSSPTGGRLSAPQITQFAQTPNKYLEYVNPQTGLTELKPSTIAGYRYDEKGNLVTDYSGVLSAPAPKDDKKYKKQLEKLGFGNVKYNSESGTYEVQLSDKSEAWLKAADIGRTKGATIQLTPSSSGFQFLGSDKKLYNIATDEKGLGGLFEVGPTGLKHIQGQYGFNQGINTATKNVSNIVAPQQWFAPKLTNQQIDQKASGGKVPVFNQAPQTPQQMGDPLNVFGFLNSKKNQPQMIQRAGGGFNYIGTNGQPISAYTYAQQTGQPFRQVLSQAAAKGDTYSAQALKYAGNDGAYNPAQVDLPTAKNWSSLTWGSNVNLQTPQAARVAGVSMPSPIPQLSTSPIPIFRGL